MSGDAARRRTDPLRGEDEDDDDEHGSKLVVVETPKTAEEGENARFPVKKKRKKEGSSNAHSS